LSHLGQSIFARFARLCTSSATETTTSFINESINRDSCHKHTLPLTKIRFGSIVGPNGQVASRGTSWSHVDVEGD